MKGIIKKTILSFFSMKLVVKTHNPILLYHSLGESSSFYENIDHVDLNILENQLKQIQKYWKFVSIDEYVEAKNKKGLASVTIDDGYKNVINEAFGVFEGLNIPLTIFINSSTFEGKIFWRDKVRYLIENDLVNEFVSSSNLFDSSYKNKFYRQTKNPIFNSIQVEKEIDEFFSLNKIDIKNKMNLCFDDEKYLIKHPLISYGNHSVNHYVMSSLNDEEQYEEIKNCQNFLESFDINTSKVFSLPFGGESTYNNKTVNILKDLRYNHCLLSQFKLDDGQSDFFIDRTIVGKTDIKLLVKSLFLKGKYESQ